MSRAAWAGLLLLGAGLGLSAYFLTRGIEPSTLAAVEAAEQAVANDARSLDGALDEFRAIVQKDPQYLDAQSDVKAAKKSFEKRQGTLKEAQAILTEQIPPLVESGEYENNEKIVQLAAKATATSSQSVTAVAANVGAARTLLDYKTRHKDLMDTARARLTTAEAMLGDSTMQTQIDLASTRCPETKPALDKRMAEIQAHARQLVQSGAQLETLAGAAPIDYVAAGKTADAITKGGDKLDKMQADLKNDIAQLERSVDKILTDMKEENGRQYHEYKIIENGVSRTTGWQEVTRSVFQQHREHLGMSVYSKPECVLPSDAEQVAAPPGYNYVGNTRYGYWEQRGGQSFWVFYGKYALMRDLLWGGSGYYRPVYRSNYGSYRSATKAGKPFYGAKKQYGTNGSTTKTRYAGSNYFKQQRRTTYNSSRYSGSGSGRRYSGSSYGGSGGSRRGGSRGSRYRSSSFGGGGK